MELDVDRKIVAEYILVKSDRMLITVSGAASIGVMG